MFLRPENPILHRVPSGVLHPPIVSRIKIIFVYQIAIVSAFALDTPTLGIPGRIGQMSSARDTTPTFGRRVRGDRSPS
jgi:hypothetical protein